MRTHEPSRFVARVAHPALLGAALCLSYPSGASALEPPPRAPTPAQVDGTYALVTAGLFVPPEGGPLGFSSIAEIGYEVAAGPLRLSTGGRVAAFFSSDVSLAAGLVTVRAQWPLEVAAPFVSASVGPGYLATTEALRATFQVGAGLLFSITQHASIGGEASYIQLGRADFKQLYLGPCVRVFFD
jgi:hypothetical protein